jgi:putative minor teichoic acid biosynthesis protein ggaB
MVRTLDRTKDIFLDTMLLGNEILIKKIKTTNKTKITVVLAAYRSVKRLQEIINNLFNQSFQDFEVIVVDDLSSSEIEEAVAAVDSSKINYIKKQLGSNSSAKNCALDFAKGEYVVFVEENSKLKQNYLEILYNEISKNNLDIAMLTRDGYPSILDEKISSGQEYLVEEIKRLKSDLNYNITSCMFKRKFLDIYNLRFQEDMLVLENLYFKLKTFDIAGKVSQIGKVGYKDLLEKKSVRNNAMIDASTRRIMIAVNKIEEFKQNKKYEESLNLLCGYLLFDVLRMHENMSEEIEILELIKSRKNYFESDTFVNKTMIAMSPIMFANHLNRKDRR